MGNGQMKKSTQMQLSRYRKMRWFVFVGVLAGIAVSVALNVLHAPPTTVGRLIAAWPPIALFAGIELISRIPTTNRWLSIGRVLATLVVAGVAGSVSYVHMMGTVEQYGGETGWQAAIWPLSVDGLMLSAAISLVEVVRKIRALEIQLETETEASESATTPVVVAPTPPPAPVPVEVPTVFDVPVAASTEPATPDLSSMAALTGFDGPAPVAGPIKRTRRKPTPKKVEPAESDESLESVIPSPEVAFSSAGA